MIAPPTANTPIEDPADVTFTVPRAMRDASEFRREVQENIRVAVMQAYLDGKLDSDRVDELYRAVQIERVSPPWRSSGT